MYNLRNATDNDYDFLYELNKITMMKYVEKIWGWDENEQQKFFSDKFLPDKYKIIVHEALDIGVISVTNSYNDVFINILEILPEYQNNGIGTEIINQIIDDSKSKNCKRVWLQVIKTNPAKKLYKRLGFSVIDETETHYVMEIKLN